MNHISEFFDEDKFLGEMIANKLREALSGKKEAKEVAEAIYSVLRDVCSTTGQNPDIETFMRTPAQSLASGHPHGDCYVISWEAGPYQWVHHAWPVVMDYTGRLCEPYYSFDLCIYENE